MSFPPSQTEIENAAHTILEVEIGEVAVNPHQPRRTFGKEELEELAESIRELGLLQPPVVRWVEERRRFELVAGERRYRAAYLAGMTKIPVIVKEADAFFSAQAALVENIQRVDLNPLEIARALAELRKLGLTLDELAKKIGKKRSTISNYLRILELPREVQEALEASSITMGHAKAILSKEGKSEQLQLLHEILEGGLSVRRAEEKVSKVKRNRVKKEETDLPTKDIHLEEIRERIQQYLGTKVTLTGDPDSGKLIIDFYGQDDLERVAELIGVVFDGT